MATVDAVVLSHHRKTDGTYNVKFRVSHKGIKRYIDTEHFISDRQLDRKGKIKDTFLLRILDRTVLSAGILVNAKGGPGVSWRQKLEKRRYLHSRLMVTLFYV